MMTINRKINGTVHAIELTKEEIRHAYYEKQHEFDIEDVEAYFAGFDDEDLLANYGKSRAEIESMFDEIAYEMRRNIDKYDLHWDVARETAISELL